MEWGGLYIFNFPNRTGEMVRIARPDSRRRCPVLVCDQSSDDLAEVCNPEGDY